MTSPEPVFEAPYNPKHFRWMAYVPYEFFAWIACLLIPVGLLGYRACISIGMITLFLHALLNGFLKDTWNRYTGNPYYYLLGLYSLVLLVSGLWSDDKTEYFNRLQVLLPVITMPFALCSLYRYGTRLVNGVIVGNIILISIGIIVSLYSYLHQKAEFDLAYGVAKLIPTPKGDHIRFSIWVVISIILGIDLWIRNKQRAMRLGLSLFILLATVYLHILAVRTGLLGFYLAAAIGCFKLIRKPEVPKRTLLIMLLTLIALPMLMYKYSVTLQHKISYMKYSWEQLHNQDRQPMISDEGRLISYRYAINILRKNLFTGVGLGDVQQEMRACYIRDFGNKDYKTLLPHNQFLMAGCAAGIPACLLLLAALISCLRKTLRRNDLSLLIVVVLVCGLMVEPMLETQFGVAAFVFFLYLLLQRHGLSHDQFHSSVPTQYSSVSGRGRQSAYF